MVGNAKRVKGVSLSQGIVYGSQSQRLTKTGKAGEQPPEHTHKWTVFVRGPHNEDLSFLIKKVQFNLHSTYQNPTRVVDKHPFEIHETGWGEFDIPIRIFFTTAEKSVQLSQIVKLHPPIADPNYTKPVIMNRFDELVFNEPLETTHKLLMEHQATASLPKKKSSGIVFTVESEQEEVEMLEKVRQKVKDDEEMWREKARDAEERLAAVKAEFTEMKANNN